MSISQGQKIRELEQRVEFLEAAVSALLKVNDAPPLPTDRKASRFGSILGLKPKNG